jgi:hypothetical protein
MEGNGDDNSIREIEITPKMVEAGMDEYAARWCGLRDADDDVAREMITAAFRAMYRLLPKSDHVTT